MKRSYWVGLCVVFAMLCIALTPRPLVRAQEQVGAPANRIAGKLLVIYTDGENRGAVLEKAQIEMIGGRQFVTGTSVDVAARDWMTGAKVWLPVESLTYVIEFNSLDEYRKRLIERPQATEDAPPATRPVLRGGGL